MALSLDLSMIIPEPPSIIVGVSNFQINPLLPNEVDKKMPGRINQLDIVHPAGRGCSPEYDKFKKNQIGSLLRRSECILEV